MWSPNGEFIILMMDKLRLILLAIAGATLFSCSNEFELNAPAEEIPIVYGLLSRADEAHYIRVERAFIDDKVDALRIAQDPNALYFEDIIVEIVREFDGQGFVLEKVDGSQLGLEREPGIFATQPNILYKIDASVLDLREDEVYRLNIRKPDSEDILTTATTPIVNDLRLNRPIPGTNKLPLRILEEDEITIIWGADETAKIFDVSMLIHYEEFDPDDPNSVVEKMAEWKLAVGREAIDGANKVEVEGLEFYRFLSSQIEENPAVLRVLKNIDLKIDAGGIELSNYINVGQANTGITSAQLIPNYTNLSKGLGLFAARNQLLEKGFVIDSQTKELLKNSELTKDLNFQ